MKQEIKHTPLPWEAHFDTFDDCWCVKPTDEAMGGTPRIGNWSNIAALKLSDEEDSENAAFIVRACNAHYALVKALEDCLAQNIGCANNHYQEDAEAAGGVLYGWHIQQAEEALKLAKGE